MTATVRFCLTLFLRVSSRLSRVTTESVFMPGWRRRRRDVNFSDNFVWKTALRYLKSCFSDVGKETLRVWTESEGSRVVLQCCTDNNFSFIVKLNLVERIVPGLKYFCLLNSKQTLNGDETHYTTWLDFILQITVVLSLLQWLITSMIHLPVQHHPETLRLSCILCHTLATPLPYFTSQQI